MTGTTRFRPLRTAATWEDRFWRVLEDAVPRDVRAHLRTARREILLAARTVIDDVVARGEQEPISRRTRKAKAG